MCIQRMNKCIHKVDKYAKKKIISVSCMLFYAVGRLKKYNTIFKFKRKELLTLKL